MLSTSQHFAELLIRLRWVLLAGAVVAAAVALPASRNVEFDRRIENMFAADDPLLVPYRHLKETFGGNEIVLAVYVDEQLLDKEGAGIRRLERISGKLKRVPGVRDVLSLAEVNRPLEVNRKLQMAKDPLRLPFRLKQAKGPAILGDDEAASKYRDLFVGYTHGHDGRTAAVACMLIPESETKVPRRETIDALRNMMENELPAGLSPGTIAGEPVMVVDGFRYVEEDGSRLGWASTLLLAVVIVVCFRSLRWVLIPLAVVQLTLLLTQATLVWSGLQLSMVSSMLTAIVTVVGIATVVHIIVRFRDARAAGLSSQAALTQAGTLLAVPIFWACTTDAVGFLSLTWAKVGPVHDFGVMMAIGSVLVLVGVVLVLPGLALWGRFDTDPKRAWGEGRLDTELHRLVTWVERHPWKLMLSTVVVVTLAAVGISRVEVETDFTKNFRHGSPVVQSYEFVENNFGGAGVWDVILPAPQVLTEDYLQRVRNLERRLRKIEVTDPASGKAQPALTKVISFADADLASQSMVGLDKLSVEARAFGMRKAMPTFTEALRNTKPAVDGGYYLRVMLRARERQPARQKQWIIEEVRRITAEEFPAGVKPAAEVTGFFVLLTNLIESMIRDQWVTFGIATASIGLMMLVAFRSPVLALVALVPNALPILMVLGMMGWIGMKINMGAAMIAAVSMGLSIDSSIHYIISFRRARMAGQTVHGSLAEVQQSVGRAVVFSTLALIVGFTVLATSQFVPTIYFGVLVSLSMLGGLAGNLVVLPLLLKLTAGRE